MPTRNFEERKENCNQIEKVEVSTMIKLMVVNISSSSHKFHGVWMSSSCLIAL